MQRRRDGSLGIRTRLLVSFGRIVAVVGSLACAQAPSTTSTTSAPVSVAATGKTMIAYSELVASPAPPADHREAYAPGPQQFGELRLPTARNARVPVVVFLHGGCWLSAYDLKHVAAAAASIAAAGYAVWVPEYRRVGDAGGGWPGTLEDVGSAVDHLRVLAAKFSSLDTARVILAGHSAGGHLALWAASRRPGEPSPGARSPLAVAGVVSLAGITDLAEYGAATGSCNRAVGQLMGGTAAELPERYRLASPIARAPIGVPVHVVHGAQDPIVPVAQSRAFVEKSKGAGGVAELVEVPGAGHFDVVSTASTSWPAVLEAIRAIAPLGGRR